MKKSRILIIGGGTMGRGIAALCAISGHPTEVFEADPAARERLSPAIEESWSRALARGKLTNDELASGRANLRVLASARDADRPQVVIEAVPESLELKRRLFEELDGLYPDARVLSSNTSSLSIASIGEATRRPERVLGLHFFNPVASMPLVEIVRSARTSQEAEADALELARSLGKEPIRVRDSPGFATSRLGVALGLEAMRMVEEGVAAAQDIDRAMELGYGHRMGPLKTSDLVGLDVRLAIAETLARELDEARFRPPEILRRLVEAGRTGKKAGKGFYRWEAGEAHPIGEDDGGMG